MISETENPAVSGALSGKTVFLAASSKLLPELTAGLCALGANVLSIAVLEAEEIEDNADLDQAITNIRQYGWIIFTSAWGVSFFAKRFQGNSTLDLPKICAIGPATAVAAERHGFPVTLTAEEFTAEGVMQSLKEYYQGEKNLQGIKVLIPRALDAREFLPTALARAGCSVDAIPCYRTVMPEPDAGLSDRLRNETPDLIVFTSAKAMRNFLKTAIAAASEKTTRRRLLETVIAVIGAVTARALESEGKSAEIIPCESTVPALIDAIADFFQTEELLCRTPDLSRRRTINCG